MPAIARSMTEIAAAVASRSLNLMEAAAHADLMRARSIADPTQGGQDPEGTALPHAEGRALERVTGLCDDLDRAIAGVRRSVKTSHRARKDRESWRPQTPPGKTRE